MASLEFDLSSIHFDSPSAEWDLGKLNGETQKARAVLQILEGLCKSEKLSLGQAGKWEHVKNEAYACLLEYEKQRLNVHFKELGKTPEQARAELSKLLQSHANLKNKVDAGFRKTFESAHFPRTRKNVPKKRLPRH
ncbi:MAG: hypothetical protein V1847_02245 [Candidatus Diapherotrites archaeon]